MGIFLPLVYGHKGRFACLSYDLVWDEAEALVKMNRQANEMVPDSGTATIQ